MKSIAILMTVFNRRDTTLRCLRELESQNFERDKYSVQVFLTDDGCTDGTPEAVRESFPNVTIIKGNGSLFWNRGMYSAWKEAAKSDFDYYMWLNDDTFLSRDAIKRLLKESDGYNNEAIVVGSTCAVGNPDKITYGGWHRMRLITDLSKPQPCDEINGNIVLIPRFVYNILGTNDPYFHHAAGDIDYGLRAKEAGVKSFTGVGVFGECDLHERPTVWMDSSQPFKKRWKNFLSPTGNNPFEFFYFKRRHFGIFQACKIFVTMWIHFFFPKLWEHK